MMFGRAPSSQAASPETLGESLEGAEDVLFDFFDFFDRTVDNTYARILRETNSPQLAEDILVDSYFSLLRRRRFLFWKKGAEEAALTSLIDAAIGAVLKKQVMVLTNIPRSLSTGTLPKDRKAELRMTLLTKYRRARMTTVQFVMPIAAMSTVAGCFLVFSTTFLTPVSAQGTLKRIAAAEVLLTEQELAYKEVLSASERDLQGVAAHFAERDLAHITVALAPYALTQQVNLEQEVEGTLWRLGTRSFFLSALAPPRVFAETEKYPLRQ